MVQDKLKQSLVVQWKINNKSMKTQIQVAGCENRKKCQ